MKWTLQLFYLCSNLNKDDIISYRPGLKTGEEKDILNSETGSGFGERGSTPPPRILRSTPPQVKMKGSHKETHSKLKGNYNDNRDKPLQYFSILNTL